MNLHELRRLQKAHMDAHNAYHKAIQSQPADPMFLAALKLEAQEAERRYNSAWITYQNQAVASK